MHVKHACDSLGSCVGVQITLSIHPYVVNFSMNDDKIWLARLPSVQFLVCFSRVFYLQFQKQRLSCLSFLNSQNSRKTVYHVYICIARQSCLSSCCTQSSLNSRYSCLSCSRTNTLCSQNRKQSCLLRCRASIQSSLNISRLNCLILLEQVP